MPLHENPIPTPVSASAGSMMAEHSTEHSNVVDRSSSPGLSVEDLTMHYLTRQGTVRAVDGVSFGLEPGGCLGLVGESGCGKSSIALSLMNLLPDNARLVRGAGAAGRT